MEKISLNINKIKQKLAIYGVTFENYRETTGNFIGTVRVPSKLYTLNPYLKVDEAFYLIAIKVFELCNLFCLSVPNEFVANWKLVVGEKVFHDFQSAIYEEINYRWMSNDFPEFKGLQTITTNSFNVSGESAFNRQDIESFLNPITRQKLANIDWLAINPEEQWNPAFATKADRLLTNLKNLNLLPLDVKTFLMADETGGFLQIPENAYVTIAEYTEQQKRWAITNNNLNKAQSDIAAIQQKDLATKSYVDGLVLNLPKISWWDSEVVYDKNDTVLYDYGLWISLKNHNLDKVPGGLSGDEYWAQLKNVIDIQIGQLVYEAGTDFKISVVNPNSLFYVDLTKLTDVRNLSEFISKLREANKHLQVTDDQIARFWQNLTANEQNLKILVNSLIPVFVHKNQMLFFNSENDFNEQIGKPFGLVKNVDYRVLDTGRYLRTATYPDTGGWADLTVEFMLTRANLPNVSLDHWHHHGTAIWDNQPVRFGRDRLGNNVGVLYSRGDQHNWYARTSGTTLNLNGNVPQQKVSATSRNIPLFRTVTVILFHKEIRPKVGVYSNLLPIQAQYQDKKLSMALDSFANKQDVRNELMKLQMQINQLKVVEK